MKQIKTKDIPLMVGLSIPILITLIVAGSVYGPRLFHPAQAQYDFLYSTGGYFGQNFYSVQNEKLSIPTTASGDVRLFIHDVRKNESSEISADGAQNLVLSPLVESPDGFMVAPGNSASGLFPFFVFGETDFKTTYLKGHGTRTQLHTALGLNHQTNFDFIGWILR